MKRLLPISLAALTGVAILGTVWHADRTPAYTARVATAQANDAQGMAAYLNMLRRNMNTGQVEPGDYLRAYAAARSYSASQTKAVGLQWQEMGPNNVGGRTRSICIHPSAPNTIWAGGVSGGLWRSEDGANTWFRMQGLSESLIISSIAVTNSGNIYVATGHSVENSGGGGGSGFIGHGLFKSSDGGASFSLVIGPSAPWSSGDPWSSINKIVADPTDANKLFVAHAGGFRIYDEAANSFSIPPLPFPQTASACTALEVVKDDAGVTAIILRQSSGNWRSVDGGNSFLQRPNGSGLPTSGFGRMEFAISPEDHNYMYALASTGSGGMHGGWSSTDGGVSWNQIWPSGSDAPSLNIFGDNNQGWYDIVISVNPNDKEEIFLGGVSLWRTSLNGAPEQVAIAQDFPGCFVCVHADVHELTWSPDGLSLYVGCDGGVYRSYGASGNMIWTASNHNYNVTQFYSAAISPKGKVVGGTQDNGTQYVPLYPGDEQRADEVFGGDGFDCEISQLDPNIMFATVYLGALGRSNNEGGVFGDFYNTRVLALGEPGSLTNGIGDFYTNIRLFEDANDLNSPDSGLYAQQWIVQGTPFTVGDTIGDPYPYNSRKMPAVPLPSTTWSLAGFPAGTTAGTVYDVGDTVRYVISLPDRTETLLAVGFTGTEGVWVTRDACNFSTGAEWFKVATTSGGNVNVLEWSPNGDALFWGTEQGEIFRVMGFDAAYDSTAMDVTSLTNVLSDAEQIYTGASPITGLCVDPNNNNNLLVTLGGYGGNGKVRFCDNALQITPTFDNVWDNLGADLNGMPVYDGIIHSSNSSLFVVGTEFGVMTSEDLGQTWVFENTGMEMVPTFQVRQQNLNWQNQPHGVNYVTNPGVIYLGTHGRGFWRSETLLGVVPPGVDGSSDATNNNLLIFPNPARDVATIGFELRSSSYVQATVYDLNGRVVRTIAQQRMGMGQQRLSFNVGDLNNGTYLVDLRVDGKPRSGRFVVSR